MNGKVIAKKYYESKERPQEQARNWHRNLSEKKENTEETYIKVCKNKEKPEKDKEKVIETQENIIFVAYCVNG